MSAAAFRLKVQKIEQTCWFELSWGKGQQLSCTLNYPQLLTGLYQEWQRIYLSFYKSALRGRLEDIGGIAAPAIDWHARLVQAEAKFLYEFHYWLRSAELFEIRATIAKSQLSDVNHQTLKTTDIFLTCEPVELARLPWESWEVGAEFGSNFGAIRIARTPKNIRYGSNGDKLRKIRKNKARILVILGDDTGLNFQTDKQAVLSCKKVADIEFVGWQPGISFAELKANICAALADERGWDVLLFAGHSNETQLTGGELAIAPNTSLSMIEILPQLQVAKARGLQFALFNSCSGINIAESLIDLGLSQVAVMREPVHNSVAQAFLLKFLQVLAEHKDVHSAMLAACQHLKLENSLTYPSASLIPSLFCHPDADLFQIPPAGWKQQVKRFLPTKIEAIALSTLALLSLSLPVQDFLLERRILTQAIYRHVTGQVPVVSPPVLLVQIDEQSIRKALIADPKPMDRVYLAKLVNKLTALNAKVVGIDYLFDRPHGNSDRILSQSLKAAVKQPNPTWFVFASVRDDNADWLTVLPEIASFNWSLEGSIHLTHWYVSSVPKNPSVNSKLPFAYLLALAYRLNVENFNSNLPNPHLQSKTDFFEQLNSYLSSSKELNYKILFSARTQLEPITSFSYDWNQMWCQPIIDFSIPPAQVYQRIPAWELLESKVGSPKLRYVKQQVVIIAPGGYGEAGVIKEGQDNYPLPAALSYWFNGQQQSRSSFTGGEAHAYIVHHFLTFRLVIPIPDLWAIALAALLGKPVTLALLGRRRLAIALLLGGTIVYGLVSLQVYIWAAVLLPWLLPSLMFWVYAIPMFVRRKIYE